MSGWKCSCCGADLQLRIGSGGLPVMACPYEDDREHFMNRKKKEAEREWDDSQNAWREDEWQWPRWHGWR